jgi:hypothetical protein
MGCDYYIQTELVIEYQNKYGTINTIYTDRNIARGYIHSYPDEDSDDDIHTQHIKYTAELERRIEQNTFTKMLFENKKWVKDSYKSKYADYLMNTFKDIVTFVRVYKNVHAWDRN